jgi:hypothetical protein
MICPSAQPSGEYFRVSRADSTTERPTPFSTGARKAGCSDYVLGQVFGILGYAAEPSGPQACNQGRPRKYRPEWAGNNRGQTTINRRKSIALTVYFAPRRVT